MSTTNTTQNIEVGALRAPTNKLKIKSKRIVELIEFSEIILNLRYFGAKTSEFSSST
jgi:hypothetical protein